MSSVDDLYYWKILEVTVLTEFFMQFLVFNPTAFKTVLQETEWHLINTFTVNNLYMHEKCRILEKNKIQLDRTRRKASEICLRPPLGIYSHTFSR